MALNACQSSVVRPNYTTNCTTQCPSSDHNSYGSSTPSTNYRDTNRRRRRAS